jgi:beta-propeller repeat-containing protein
MRAFPLLFLAACSGGGAVDNPCARFVDRQWGTALDDEALALIPAQSGGVYVAGYSGGTLGSSNLGPVGDSRGFVRRLSGSGAVQWEAWLDTAATDVIEALAEGSAGTLYAAGRTTGAFPGAALAGQFDAFTAILGSGGAVSSVRQFGDERPQHPRRLALSGGRLLVVGYDDIFVPTNSVEDWENWFAAELSATDLAQRWNIPARTQYGDLASAVIVDSAGTTYVAGSNAGGAQPGIWLRKLDAAGHELWGSRLSSNGLDTSAALAFAKDGTLLLAGTHFGGSEPVLISVDPASGAPRWTTFGPRDLTGTGVNDMVVDGEGNVYVTGSTSNAIAPQYTNRGLYDPYVVRFDAAAKLTGTWQGGSASDEEPTAIALDSCGRILISGWTDGAITAGASSGRRDAFLLSVQLQNE